MDSVWKRLNWVWAFTEKCGAQHAAFSVPIIHFNSHDDVYSLICLQVKFHGNCETQVPEAESCSFWLSRVVTEAQNEGIELLADSALAQLNTTFSEALFFHVPRARV